MEWAPNSSDEESEADDDAIVDDDDDDERGKLPPGSAKVRWSKVENVKTEYTSNLQLVDRVFLLGDIVARANNQLGQTGIVVGMRQYCNIRRWDGSELKQVDGGSDSAHVIVRLGRAQCLLPPNATTHRSPGANDALAAARSLPSGRSCSAPARALAWAR